MTDIDKEIAFLEAQLELLTKQIKQAQENITQTLFVKKAFSERLKQLQKTKKYLGPGDRTTFFLFFFYPMIFFFQRLHDRVIAHFLDDHLH